MATFVGSPLDSATVTPPAGAGAASVTAKVADWFGPTDTFAGSVMVPSLLTLTFAEPLVYPVAEAVSVTDPVALPEIVNVAEVLPLAMLTDA